MKVDFFKRIFAYLIDYFIIMIVLMGITASVTKEINDVMNDYKEGNITVEEYTEKVMPLNYELTKRKLPVNVATSVVFIGYYIIFAYFNKGQTLGKKLLKIKVVKHVVYCIFRYFSSSLFEESELYCFTSSRRASN